MGEKVKYMDMEEFRTAGFLQESNRMFFHPHGLALEWSTGWTKQGLEDFIVNAMKEEAAAAAEDPDEVDASVIDRTIFEGVWSFIVRAGLDKPRISGVWDDRDDPEGIAFGYKDEAGEWHPWASFDQVEVLDKADRVMEERLRHIEGRSKLFGYHVPMGHQRLPEPPPEDE